MIAPVASPVKYPVSVLWRPSSTSPAGRLCLLQIVASLGPRVPQNERGEPESTHLEEAAAAEQ